MKPIACVDLGTNTCLMLVATLEDGHVKVLADRARIIRLGEGVDRTGHLADGAKTRALQCFEDFAREARALGAERLVGVATSAMRDSSDGRAFAAEIAARTGFVIEIITGEAEAELAYAAVAADFSVAGRPLAVFDIGGGSTELMHGSGRRLVERVSIDVGSVRMTERFLKSDPPAVEELKALEDHVRGAVSGRARIPAGAPLVGIAGTVTALAACSMGLAQYDAAKVHGSRLRLTAVESLRRRFAALPARERVSITPLEPGRADVIVAGALVCEEVMRACGVDEIIVGDRGVRFGVFWRTVGGVVVVA